MNELKPPRKSLRDHLDDLASDRGATITIDSIAPVVHVREPHPKPLSARLDVNPSDSPIDCAQCRECCWILYIEQRRAKSSPMCKSCHLARLEQRHQQVCVWCDYAMKRGTFKHQCFLNADGGPPIVHVCTACGETGVTYQLVQERFGEAALRRRGGARREGVRMMRGDRCPTPLTDRLNIASSLPPERCAAVTCNVYTRQLYRDARRWREGEEFETPQAEVWFCKSCREKQQSNVVHCGWCDHTLDSNESTRQYHYRDEPAPDGNGRDGVGPLIPICSHCSGRNIGAAEFAISCGEATLYIEQPEPLSSNDARRVISAAERVFGDG